MRGRTAAVLAVWALATSATLAQGRGAREPVRSSLLTVEGTVAEVGERERASGSPVVVIAVEAAESRLELLLAPQTVLDQVEFRVRTGQRVRAKVFLTDDPGPRPVHKIMNLSEHTMVRLRTLHRIPLWDSTGRWQGAQGGRGGRHRGPPPARGPGGPR